jgi:probable HAF family extracellular repeat protein
VGIMSRLRLSRIAALATLTVAAGVPAATVVASPAGAATTTYTITDLGSLGGGVTHGLAINASGQVTGDSFLSKQVQVPCPYPQPPNQKCFANLDHAFFWSNGTMTGLGPSFSPAAINDSGVIVGGAFVESAGTLQNLNNLIPAGSGYQIESATGINDNGQIVANATDTATGQTHALLLTPH